MMGSIIILMVGLYFLISYFIGLKSKIPDFAVPLTEKSVFKTPFLKNLSGNYPRTCIKRILNNRDECEVIDAWTPYSFSTEIFNTVLTAIQKEAQWPNRRFLPDDKMFYLTEEYGPDMQYVTLLITLEKHFQIEITEFSETLADLLNLISQKTAAAHHII